MEKKPQVPATYDSMFDGGSNGVFDLPYKRSPYYPLFRGVSRTLAQSSAQRVLEVGCGTGAMAHMLFETSRVGYRGFDFSPVAIEKAKARTGRPDAFFVGDATSTATYVGTDYDTVVCTEVLEHIEDDLLAMNHWTAGAFCVCSVPNYDADTHVRHFRTEQEVAARYGSVVDIESIQKIRKPLLDDLSVANWLRAVKWNRYRPDRLRWLFGLSDFDSDGGWFVFSGRRRAA